MTDLFSRVQMLIFNTCDQGFPVNAGALADAIISMTQQDAANSEDAAFIDGLKAAARMCGTLAETTYDDADGFAAAIGCEAAIMEQVGHRQRELEATAVAKGADK